MFMRMQPMSPAGPSIISGVFNLLNHFASIGDQKKMLLDSDDDDDFEDPTDEELIDMMFPDEDSRDEYLEDGI